MDKQEALVLANAYIKEKQKNMSYELQIREDITREEDFGWIFFYNTKKYIETRDNNYLLVGNSPIIINRKTGQIEVTGTGNRIEHYIDLYKKFGTCRPK